MTADRERLEWVDRPSEAGLYVCDFGGPDERKSIYYVTDPANAPDDGRNWCRIVPVSASRAAVEAAYEDAARLCADYDDHIGMNLAAQIRARGGGR